MLFRSRETREELGIPAERIELLGDLDFLYLRSEGLMYPVLALMGFEHHTEKVSSSEYHVWFYRVRKGE